MNNSYRNIFKGISIFGGVQVFQVLVNLIRGKFVAVILGPEGMGVSALFNNAFNTVSRLSSLGLNLAIVKDVAAAAEHDGGTPGALAQVIGVARRLMLVAALLGALICVVFAYPLSRFSFGSDSYAQWFMLLGVAVFFSLTGGGLSAMLQGMHEVKRLSLASLVGSLAGLLLGVPLYYFFGTRGIVPAMVLLTLCVYLFYFFQLRAATRHNTDLHEFRFIWKIHKPIVKRLISLGLLLMASDLIGTALNYLLNAIIRWLDDVQTVGLYQAANSLTNQYVGVVFTAMAMDYFPRLSACAESNRRMTVIVNRQLEIVCLIIAPIIALLVFTTPVIIRLLLSSEFIEITPLMRWMGLGVLFRAIMFPTAYISMAKDNKKVFFWLEGIFCNLMTFVLSVAGFYFYGLLGLGYAMVADNFLCLIVYIWLNNRLYGYRVSLRGLRGMLLAAAVGVLVIAASFIPLTWLSYTVMALISAASLTFSLLTLRRLLAR